MATKDPETSRVFQNAALEEKGAVALTVFYLILTTTRAFDFWKGNTVAAAYAESWKGNIVISLLGNLVLLLLIPFLAGRIETVRRNVARNWPLALFFGYALLSCLWSEYPGIALRRWVKIFVFFLLMMNISSMPNPIRVFRKTFVLFIYIVSVLSLLFIIFSRTYGWQPYDGGALPCGIFGHKIGFGLFCAVAFFVMLWCCSSGEAPFQAALKKHGVLLAALPLGLVASGTVSSLGGVLLASAITLLVFTGQRRGNPYLAAFLLLMIGVSLLFAFLVSQNIVQADFLEFILKPMGKDPTFTGRTTIWKTSLDFGLKNNPVLGSGFGTLFMGEKSSWLQSVYGWAVWGSHSAYIETFLETGFVGFAILLVVIVHLIVNICREVFGERAQPLTLLSLLVLLIFVNFFTVDILSPTFPFFLLLFLSIYQSISKSLPARSSAAPLVTVDA